MSHETQPNSLAALLTTERNRGLEILDLTESNPTRAGFPYDQSAILSALSDPRALLYEPAAFGLPEARCQIAKMHGVSVERVVLTASTSEAYSWLFKLLADPGEEVFVPSPSYPLFEFLADLEAVHARPYPLAYHGGWSIDFEALEAAIQPLTRAVVLVNPNNPTGSYLKRPEVERLIEIAREHELALIADEVFSDYAWHEDTNRVRTLNHVEGVLTFCLNGLSKLAGLPQMKLGWIVAGGPESIRSEALERLEVIADTYLSVGAPVQFALPALLAAGDTIRPLILERVKRNLAAVEDSVRAHPEFGLLRAEGGWYATLQVPRVRSEEEWAIGLLRDQHVLVQPGYFYDFANEAYLVLSLLTEPGMFDEGLRRIMRAI